MWTVGSSHFLELNMWRQCINELCNLLLNSHLVIRGNLLLKLHIIIYITKSVSYQKTLSIISTTFFFFPELNFSSQANLHLVAWPPSGCAVESGPGTALAALCADCVHTGGFTASSAWWYCRTADSFWPTYPPAPWQPGAGKTVSSNSSTTTVSGLRELITQTAN